MIVIDPQFLLGGPGLDERGKTLLKQRALLLFTTREFAERCRAMLQVSDTVIATFLGWDHLEASLLDLMARGWQFAIIDRLSGVGHESVTSIQDFIIHFK